MGQRSGCQHDHAGSSANLAARRLCGGWRLGRLFSVNREDVLQLLEELYTALARTIRPDRTVITPFPRLSYQDAMDRYASDKPDLRYGLEIADITDIAEKTILRCL